MEDFRLKVLCSVARNRSLTKASHEMHITQPAITKYIQEYEQEYGVTLFNRTNSGVELTDAGELMLAHADNILQQYKAMDYDMHLMSHAYSGVLRLGASHTISQYVLPSFMASFTAKFKQIQLSLFEGDSREVEQALENREIDLGLVESFNRTSHLRCTPFMYDEMVLVTSRAGSYAHIDTVNIHELMKYPLVVGKCSCDSISPINKALETQGLDLSQFNVIAQLSSSESIKRYINNTDCFAIVSVQSIVQEIKMGVLKVIEIDDMSMSREFVFIRNIEETSGISKDFISYMQQGLLSK